SKFFLSWRLSPTTVGSMLFIPTGPWGSRPGLYATVRSADSSSFLQTQSFSLSPAKSDQLELVRHQTDPLRSASGRKLTVCVTELLSDNPAHGPKPSRKVPRRGNHLSRSRYR